MFYGIRIKSDLFVLFVWYDFYCCWFFFWTSVRQLVSVGWGNVHILIVNIILDIFTPEGFCLSHVYIYYHYTCLFDKINVIYSNYYLFEKKPCSFLGKQNYFSQNDLIMSDSLWKNPEITKSYRASMFDMNVPVKSDNCTI